MRVLSGVVLGIVLGLAFREQKYLFGSIGNAELGRLGLLVVKLLKALAVPLVFFAILDAFVKTDISLRKGTRLIVICAINATVALGIGLAIMNAFTPGRHLAGTLAELYRPGATPTDAAAQELLAASKKGSLGLLDNIASYVPRSLVDPFSENSVITVVLLGLLVGVALRRARARGAEGSMSVVEQGIGGIYAILVEALDIVVGIVPFGVLGVVADVVGKAGLRVFASIWIFLVTVLAAMALHSLVYYPLVAWLVGKKPPRVYLGIGADPILTGLSTNSSLATVPVTLKALDRMGVSPASSRLAACIGTNLNNDGILLYEAITAVFLTQAMGMPLGLGSQVTIGLASVMAAAGIAGIPEAGLVVLPLVLAAAGLPDALIATAIPLVMTVDWIIARLRTGVNVMSDMLVAVLLDVGDGEKKSSGATPEGGGEGVADLLGNPGGSLGGGRDESP
ncbi:dicarboxylate/amino acid:cation symporter [Polyangium jinanense]|uniref:Cation:dicarboxylase symporter family transporter n=1 Tax=Polyangium jinanense TaxID=2829994 RepID=A0A9X3XCD8_9BACT|nr:cation:dicarboxylase symporter family transporter [Polyangium jinanense]MDC3957708.1 cation:dicarboxylase symporter family transporter [Polyangium jinanense]MDC3987779.1 cation:dicarboxylase symporter family transporter [Polyangium jinanense]